MKRRAWALLCIVWCRSISWTTSLIPSPNRMEMGKGCFKIKKNIVVYAEDTTFVPVRFLLNEIIGMDNASIRHTRNPRKADISFRIKGNGHQEAYELEIGPELICIEANGYPPASWHWRSKCGTTNRFVH